MLLAIFISVIVGLTVAAVLSLNAEQKWLHAESTSLDAIRTAASQPFNCADELVASSGISPNARVAICLRNAEVASVMGHLPDRHHFPYIPNSRNERFLLILRNASITCMLIFGLAGTFLKLTGLVPAGRLQQILSAEGNNSSNELAEFLKGIEGGLRIAFTPSIVAILAMVLVLLLRHWWTEGRRQSLVQGFHDFSLSTFAKTIHGNQVPTLVAASTAETFLKAAKSIRESTDLLNGSLAHVKEEIRELKGATSSLKTSTENLCANFAEDSPLIGSIGALFEVASPLDDRYQQIASHLNKIEQSLAKHNGAVAKTFDGILELAVAAKQTLPTVTTTVASTFKPISESANDWLSAGKRWESVLTKAMPAESKRIEAISTALADPTAILPTTLRELKTAIERNDALRAGDKNLSSEILTLLQRIEQHIKTNGSTPTPIPINGNAVDSNAVVEELKGMRALLEANQASKLHPSQVPENSKPAVVLPTGPSHQELKEYRELLSRIDKQQESINLLVRTIQPTKDHNVKLSEANMPQSESSVLVSDEEQKKPGIFKRIFRKH
jgi:hypothetical protein